MRTSDSSRQLALSTCQHPSFGLLLHETHPPVSRTYHAGSGSAFRQKKIDDDDDDDRDEIGRPPEEKT